MNYCPLCQQKLEAEIEEYRSGEVIDLYCPTMVKSVNGPNISHFRSGGLVERTYALVPPFRAWQDPRDNKINFTMIGKNSFTHIMTKPLMSIEDAIQMLRKLANLKSFA